MSEQQHSEEDLLFLAEVYGWTPDDIRGWPLEQIERMVALNKELRQSE